MLISMKGFKYEKFNLLEWMHNLGRAWDNLLNFLVGLEPPRSPPPTVVRFIDTTRAHTPM